MRIASGEALLLEVTDLSEYDRVVSFLVRGHGKRRGVARGARRRFSRYAGQLQPLAKVQVTWFEREDRELVRIRGLELLRPADRLHADLEGILLGCYLADHVKEFAQEAEPNDHLYRLLDATLEGLLAGVDRGVAARYFEAWVLRLAGIFPPPVECPECGTGLDERAVLPRGGDGLVCPRCAGSPPGLEAGAGELAFLRRIDRERLPQVAASPPQPEVLARVERIAAEVRRRFLQHELKSYLVMERTLSAI